jgi:hypothetical protein
MNQTSTLTPNHSTSAVTLAAGRSPVRCRTSLLAQAVTRHLRESTNRLEEQLDSESNQIDSLLRKVSEILCHSRADQNPEDQVNCEAASSDFTKYLLALKQQFVDSQHHKLLMEKPYGRQILLTTVLPLYLRSSSQSLSTALSYAMQLVWEHRSMKLTSNINPPSRQPKRCLKWSLVPSQPSVAVISDQSGTRFHRSRTIIATIRQHR